MNADDFCKTFGVERRNTDTRKWDSLKEVFGEEDLTPFWIADMEFKTVPEAIEAIKKRAEHGAFGYGNVPDSYYEAFFDWQSRHGMILKREEIRFATGVVGSLSAMVHAYTQPGESVIVCTPVYYPFFYAIKGSGRKLAECELVNSDGHYSLDLNKLEQLIAESKAKLFILCSPHNPVGRVWTEPELAGIFEVCRKHGLVVASDEIHQDFISPGCRFVSSSLVADGKYRDILVTMNSGSKTFNLAGLIHSHVIIYDKKLRARYDNFIKSIGETPANVLGLAGTEAAFRHGAPWLEGAKALVQKNYNYMKAEFAAKAPRVIISPLEGTYLMWMDLRPYIGTGATVDFVQKKCRLAVNVGEKFISRGGEGFIRINLATLPKYVELAAGSIIDNLS